MHFHHGCKCSGSRRAKFLFFYCFFALTFNPVISAIADEKDDAIDFLRTLVDCSPPTETTRQSDGYFLARKTTTEYLGDKSVFKMRENFVDTEGYVAGESYETLDYHEISARFEDIEEVFVSGTKATLKCRSGANCIDVLYVFNRDMELYEDAIRRDPMDCFEPGMCREESRKRKASYRISMCSPESAADMKEVIEFLASE